MPWATRPHIPDDCQSVNLEPGRTFSPSPLMGKGWGEGGYFSMRVSMLLNLPPSPNPLPPWGGGLKTAL